MADSKKTMSDHGFDHNHKWESPPHNSVQMGLFFFIANLFESEIYLNATSNETVFIRMLPFFLGREPSLSHTEGARLRCSSDPSFHLWTSGLPQDKVLTLLHS